MELASVQMLYCNYESHQLFSTTEALEAFLGNEAKRLKLCVNSEQSQEGKRLVMDISVRGFKQSIGEWISCLRIEMQNAALPGDRLRSMYIFNRDNDLAVVENDLAVVKKGIAFIEPRSYAHATWLAVSNLPKNARRRDIVVMRLIGKYGADINNIELDTKCTVKIFDRESRHPHVCILGSTAEDVAKCRDLVQKRLCVLRKQIVAENQAPIDGHRHGDHHHYTRELP